MRVILVKRCIVPIMQETSFISVSTFQLICLLIIPVSELSKKPEFLNASVYESNLLYKYQTSRENRYLELS